MKLTYDLLISPVPLYLQHVGHVKSPLLKEIWDEQITYQTYSSYLYFLFIDLKEFCKKVDPKRMKWYSSLSDNEIKNMNMFDVISSDTYIRYIYLEALDFFLMENIFWDDYTHMFCTWTDTNEDGQIIPSGIINKEIWDELCDVILQLNNVRKQEGSSGLKFKNKAAERIWKKTHKAEPKSDSKMELPNIISSVAAKDESLNMINIWDLTVYQLYDQFRRHQGNSYFNISSMRVAAWGDGQNKFDGGAWYKNIKTN